MLKVDGVDGCVSSGLVCGRNSNCVRARPAFECCFLCVRVGFEWVNGECRADEEQHV